MSVDLSARRDQIRLSESLKVTLKLTNHTGQTRSLGVILEMKRLGTKALPIQFHRWLAVVGPHGQDSEMVTVSTTRFFGATGRFRIRATTDDREPLGASLTFGVTKGKRPLPRFADASLPTGTGSTHKAHSNLISCDYAAGAAWGDIEGDGDLDLFLPQHQAAGELFVNHGGTFADEAAARGVDDPTGHGLGAVFVDYDNDGDQDLYITNNGPNRLFQNDGTGHFIDVAAAAGVADAGPSTSASWGDYDRDGHLDLYVVNYGYCGGIDIDSSLQYEPDALYHATGEGTFTDVTPLLGPPDNTHMGAGFQAAWFDYDRDGDVDLYLANDFVGPKPRPNALWRNDGPDESGGWRFTDVSVSSGAGVSINTMGIGVGDYDRDGDPDLALSNIRANVLLRNNGNGTFTNVAEAMGVARDFQVITERAITWGLAFYDLDNDTREDIYVAAGDFGYEDGYTLQPNEVFLNRGRRGFADVSAPSRADDPLMTRGVAFADYDRDGRVDMYLVNHVDITRLLRNVTRRNRNHWLEVDTIGSRSNRDACGAQLTARLQKGPTLVREVFCGSISQASGSDSVVHLGLGRWDRVKRLVIRWPSGTVQVLKWIKKVDRVLTVTEPA